MSTCKEFTLPNRNTNKTLLKWCINMKQKKGAFLNGVPILTFSNFLNCFKNITPTISLAIRVFS